MPLLAAYHSLLSFSLGSGGEIMAVNDIVCCMAGNVSVKLFADDAKIHNVIVAWTLFLVNCNTVLT